MIFMYINTITDQLIRLALAEDIGTGDITTQTVIEKGSTIKGLFIAKEEGVVCGLDVVAKVFSLLDESVSLSSQAIDGQMVKTGDVIAEIEGPAHAILSGERVALNFLQHLSAIATKTALFCSSVSGTSLKIVDTRKTTPGMRILEKYAVKTGGGFNHRISLSDGVLIKDNHINAAGGIKKAIEMARMNAPQTLKIEVETETLEQVQEALDAGADIIMLDNMDNSSMTSAVKLVNGRALTEASGNMDRRNLREVAATGVDMVSIGALTHSVRAMDISLRFI
jgi:nicotinate-nucleotide pyrophosphorylase (carboxylating)